MFIMHSISVCSKLGRRYAMYKNFKDLRTEKNLSQLELSLLSKIPLSHIIELESGECKDPYIDVVARLMNALDCDFNEICHAILNSCKEKKASLN